MRRLLNFFRLRRLESDLDRELQYHLARRTGDLVRSGVPEAEARRRAALEIGRVTQVREEVRDVWLARWLRDLVYDLRFSARSFFQHRSFTATAVLSLALGIGATTAIYSLLDQVVLRGLPVRDPQRLVLIDWRGYQATINAFGSSNLMSYPICRDLQEQDRFFEGVLCRATTTINFSAGGDAAPAVAELVSGTYFPVLGVRPALGRLINTDDDQRPGDGPVVVLSHDFWITQLAGAADVVGRKVLVNRHPMTVIGIAAPEFKGIDVGEVPALWIPAAMSAQAIPGFDNMLERRVRWMQILGRLRPDITPAQAQAGLQPWFKAVLEEDTRRPGFPNITAERRQRFLASRLELTPASWGHSMLRRRLSQPLYVLFGITAVLLGLACLNVAGLFLARGSAREREIRTRLALGASRGRIARQLVADSVLVAMAGGALGIVVAPAAMRALIAFLPRDAAANALRASADARLMAFALVLSVAAGLLTGFAPALQAGRGSLMASLRSGSASRGMRLRRVLITAQIALTLVLVMGAALFVRTLTALMAKGPGFDTSSLISFGIDPARNGYPVADANRLIRRIHDQIRALPGTQSLAILSNPLLAGGSWNNMMTIQAGARSVTDREVRLNAVTPDFFATLGARIVAGRRFDERDKRVAVVNQAFANRYLAGNALGARVGMGGGPDVKPEIEIIGVMADISYRDVREESEQAYFPMVFTDERFPAGGNFYVRVRGSSEAAFQAIRTILHDADPTLPLGYIRTLDEQVSRSLNTERMLAALSGSFGALALLLSLVGLYGVISFTVTQRTSEIGIRVALGASRFSTVWLVLRGALIMTGVGIAMALPCILALGRVVEAQLYDVKPADPMTMLAAIVILDATALGAALIPAYRATALDPVAALRLD